MPFLGNKNYHPQLDPAILLCSLRFAAGQSLNVKELSVHSARCCSGAKPWGVLPQPGLHRGVHRRWGRSWGALSSRRAFARQSGPLACASPWHLHPGAAQRVRRTSAGLAAQESLVHTKPTTGGAGSGAWHHGRGGKVLVLGGGRWISFQKSLGGT